MVQTHFQQYGRFHLTTVTKDRMPWCTHRMIPQVIIDNLLMSKRIYRINLYAFCILPDHVHLIIGSRDENLSKFMHSFKRNSSRDAREIYISPVATVREPSLRSHDTCSGWQHGFHDENIRDDDQLSTALRYVRDNAYGHRLVSKPENWPWSSIHFPHLLDPIE